MDLRSTLAPYAMEEGKLYNILPAFMMAVAYLETGNGSSTLCNEANNLFSIKGNYNGKSILLNTTEYVNGRAETVKAAFKSYPSFRESCQDFCKLMVYGVSWNPTAYSRAVIGQTDLTKVCIAFGKTPYASDPSYSGKLLGVIKSFHLDIFDTLPLIHPAADTSSHAYTSIVDYLKSKKLDSSFAARAELAQDYNIHNYSGTAAENILLLKLVEGVK